MIDGAILSIIPPVVVAILTYLVANKRAKISHAKLIADMQGSAIQQVTLAEEKMRKEIWAELSIVRQENENLRQEMNTLKLKLSTSESLVNTLQSQVSTLTELVNTYKGRIVELQTRAKNNSL